MWDLAKQMDKINDLKTENKNLDFRFREIEKALEWTETIKN